MTASCAARGLLQSISDTVPARASAAAGTAELHTTHHAPQRKPANELQAAAQQAAGKQAAGKLLYQAAGKQAAGKLL